MLRIFVWHTHRNQPRKRQTHDADARRAAATSSFMATGVPPGQPARERRDSDPGKSEAKTVADKSDPKAPSQPSDGKPENASRGDQAGTRDDPSASAPVPAGQPSSQAAPNSGPTDPSAPASKAPPEPSVPSQPPDGAIAKPPTPGEGRAAPERTGREPAPSDTPSSAAAGASPGAAGGPRAEEGKSQAGRRERAGPSKGRDEERSASRAGRGQEPPSWVLHVQGKVFAEEEVRIESRISDPLSPTGYKKLVTNELRDSEVSSVVFSSLVRSLKVTVRRSSRCVRTSLVVRRCARDLPGRPL